MYGVLTDDADLARDGPGDVAYYLAERVDGTRQTPLPGAINSVACWGDTAAVRADPELAAVSVDGTPATPATEGHHWGTVCPTDPDYRGALLDRIERVGAVADVRLTTLGFPGDAYCRCDRCDRRFAASEHDDRNDWRSAVITTFVTEAAARVEGALEATLYPDPYPGNLHERAGLDLEALAPHVDGFLVPLCDVGYETTYWVEALARGFAGRLADVDATLTVQLAAGGVDPDRLHGVARRVDRHVDAVVFGTHDADVDAVGEALGRLREDDSAPAADVASSPGDAGGLAADAGSSTGGSDGRGSPTPNQTP